MSRNISDQSRIPHGTRTGYVDWQCRCEPCTQANTHYTKVYRVRGPKHRWVDAEIVRKHVLWLLDNGLTQREISRLVGRSGENAIHLFLRTRPKRVRSDFAEAVLAVGTHKRSGARWRVDPAKAVAHIERLIESGWQQKEIAAAVGVHPRTLWALCNGTHCQIEQRNEAAILALEPRTDSSSCTVQSDPAIPPSNEGSAPCPAAPRN